MKVMIMDHQKNFAAKVVEIDENNTLHEMYRLLHCDIVEHASFYFDGMEYDLWFDEEFLLKPGPYMATFLLGECKPGNCQIVCGSWMISRSDEQGCTIGLTKNDIKKLMRYIDINRKLLHIAIENRYY